MVDVMVAWDKLAQFQTADEIAGFFTGEGVKATKGDSLSCAISVWMWQATGEKIMTNTEAIGYHEIDGDGYSTFTRFAAHTPAMVDFVDGFDCGHYPDLVEIDYYGSFIEEG